METITRHQNTGIGEFTGGAPALLQLPRVWLQRAYGRHRLRQEVGCDADRIQRLELDIGLPSGTLTREMDKYFWQP